MTHKEAVVGRALEAFDVSLDEADAHLVDVFRSMAAALHAKLPPTAQATGLVAFDKLVELGCGIEALREMVEEYRDLIEHAANMIVPHA